jgi:hypothetical protein
MRRSKYPLSGAWAKVEQACAHLDRFEKMFQDFAKSISFARIVRAGEDLFNSPDDGFGSDEVWFELSCTAGDCVHNLRCALDHSAYAVAESRNLPQAILEKVYFTVRDTKAMFDRKVYKPGSVEQRIGADWIAFVESVQPFTDPKYADLGRIALLDNIDKHRVILSLTPRSDVFLQRPGEEPQQWTAEIEHGRVRIPADEPIMRFASSYVTFDDVPAPAPAKRWPAERDLLEFYSLVQDVLRGVQDSFF